MKILVPVIAYEPSPSGSALVRRMPRSLPDVRLGEAHGAGPLARNHLRQVALLQLVRAVRLDGQRGALGQARVHLPGHVPRAQHLAEREREAGREALAAPLGISRHGDPAVLAVAVVGLLEPGRRVHLAVLEAQAVLVADAVGRGEHVFGEARTLLEDALEQVLVQLLAAERPVMLLEIENFMDDETDVTKGGTIGVHGRNLPVRGFGTDFTRRCGHSP